MDKSVNPVILSVIHHPQNPLETKIKWLNTYIMLLLIRHKVNLNDGGIERNKRKRKKARQNNQGTTDQGRKECREKIKKKDWEKERARERE
jgi:BRCT domain type II-containing protein